MEVNVCYRSSKYSLVQVVKLANAYCLEVFYAFYAQVNTCYINIGIRATKINICSFHLLLLGFHRHSH